MSLGQHRSWSGRLPTNIRGGQLLPFGVSFPSSMAKYAGPRLPLVMKALGCTQNSVYEVQRITSTAFLAEVGPWGGNIIISLVLE